MRMIRSSVHQQRGASLIEVLVSILVVSLGVVAMGGLLASATRLGKASEMRAVASLMASDIADRMKANVGAARSSLYDHTDAFVSPPATPTPVNCALPLNCQPKELADQDMAQWRLSLLNALPSGTGYVRYDAGALDAAGGAVDVWVAWLDPTALSVGAFQDIDSLNAKTCPPGFRDLNPQPRCMYFRVAL
ncbi:type IV pilus modification protein PilV [Ideonella sp. 4Y16]|uniref:Type IV pilus modification protein PilV n=1 Tax=Ideonella alba TaxID=2824118 RepID=A0A940YJ47_9BURK|nr:type IV pilus modification protein PilV [Ideonella alba]MBQ0933357.1 type IV pilus modification protein PilV [Ideonella alba]MBQ0943958.1 type IV pilus modification protein PilV [Ideonella alba]